MRKSNQIHRFLVLALTVITLFSIMATQAMAATHYDKVELTYGELYDYCDTLEGYRGYAIGQNWAASQTTIGMTFQYSTGDSWKNWQTEEIAPGDQEETSYCYAGSAGTALYRIYLATGGYNTRADGWCIVDYNS